MLIVDVERLPKPKYEIERHGLTAKVYKNKWILIMDFFPHNPPHPYKGERVHLWLQARGSLTPEQLVDAFAEMEW